MRQSNHACILKRSRVVVIVVELFVVVIVSESQRFRKSGIKGVIESKSLPSCPTTTLDVIQEILESWSHRVRESRSHGVKDCVKFIP